MLVAVPRCKGPYKQSDYLLKCYKKLIINDISCPLLEAIAS